MGELDETEGAHLGNLAPVPMTSPSPASCTIPMDGDTGFFQRQGFRGWGIRMDYVVFPGLVWALEGFRLQNKKQDLHPGFPGVGPGDQRDSVFLTKPFFEPRIVLIAVPHHMDDLGGVFFAASPAAFPA